MKLEKYPFDDQFQVAVVALMFRHKGFLRDFRSIIRPEYFDKDGLTHLSRIVLTHWDTYQTEPDVTVIREEVRQLGVRLRMDAELLAQQFEWVDFVERVPLENGSEYVIDTVVRFAQRQAMRGAVAEAIEEIRGATSEALDVERIQKKIEHAARVGSRISDMGIDFSATIGQLPAILNSGSAYIERVRTPWDTLNRVTKGGFGRGEIVVIMARPGVGKTWFCVNAGAFALRCDHSDVVHYTIGDMHERDLQVRYASRLFGVTQDEIVAGSPEYHRKIQMYRFRSRLWIKYFPPGITKVDDVVAHFERLVATEKLKVGMLIVDYPDQLKGGTGESMYAAVGDIYDKLINLGTRHHCTVLAPSQVKREWDGDLITNRSIANSDLKSAKSDIMLSLNQTTEERQQGTIRLYVDKCRRGDTGDIFKLNSQLELGMLREVLRVTNQGGDVAR